MDDGPLTRALGSLREQLGHLQRLLGTTERIMGYKVMKYGIEPRRFHGPPAAPRRRRPTLRGRTEGMDRTGSGVSFR